MSQFNPPKNPPWVRTTDYSVQQPLMNPAVLQYPPSSTQSAYQAQIAIQHQALTMQQYPTQQIYNPQVSSNQSGNRGLNVNMAPSAPVLIGTNTTANSSQNSSSKQRVFTGTVTKVVDNNYGFVDENVFFQMSCVKGPFPILNDRVLVEAVCLPSMPFKWNATRVQVLPMNDPRTERSRRGSSRERSSYSSVPPPSDFEPRRNNDRDRDRPRERDRDRDRIDRSDRSQGGNRRDQSPQDDEEDRRKRRERDRRDREVTEKDRERERERDRERERERDRDRDREVERSRSPRRSRAVPTPKYRMRIPEFALDIKQFNVNLLKSRYNQMYIPSDFFLSVSRWAEAVPPYRPLTMSGPAKFHIIDKHVEPVFPVAEVIDPPDADFLYCAKVMLISIPSKEELYKKCILLAEDKEADWTRLVHPTRLIECLVGVNTRNKNEYMAIGGPWSPSLDGADPVNDPNVLIKTAIRTCKALTGIDLSNCTKWYRFAEMHYRRGKTSYKGRELPPRVETVVIYVPDIWSIMPSALEWDGLHLNYQRMLNKQLAQIDASPDSLSAVANDSSASEKTTDSAAAVAAVAVAATGAAEDEKESDAPVAAKEPTHYSLLDVKNLKVNELREELAARNLSPKGLRLQLLARLTKVLKSEQEAEEESKKQKRPSAEPEKKDETEKKEDKDKDKEKAKLPDKETLIESYKLPETPHILVHPSKTAKSGKFNCKVLSLSILLDYIPLTITKEHSFEVALFAENFNEMLMRDCGSQIYKALKLAPDKNEEKEKEKEKDQKKDEEKEKNEEEKKDEEKNGEVLKIEDEKMEVVDIVDGDGVKITEDGRKASGKEEEKEERSRRSRRRHREKIPQHTINADLLLAFSYFDVTHYGKITCADLEDLLQTLGLELSRSQVKKLSGKIPQSDNFCNYRLLTDQPAPKMEPTENEPEVAAEQTEISLAAQIMQLAQDCDETQLLLGNRAMLPKFVLTLPQSPVSTPAKRTRKAAKIDEPSQVEGFVVYKGALFSIANLNEEVKRNEAARLDAERKAFELKKTIGELKEKQDRLYEKYKNACDNLTSANRKLAATQDKLTKESVQTDIYLTTLMDVQERILPVIDTDEIKRLIQARQNILGAPTINLVPLSKIEDIQDSEMAEIKPKIEDKDKK